MTSIVIASENRVKIDAIKKAFTDFLYDRQVVASGIEVQSEVGKQPFDEAVANGAKNRLRNLRKTNVEGDYYVSCEGGVANIFGTYYNIHVVVIEDKFGNSSMGISQGFPIPRHLIPEIKRTSIASVLDRIFNGTGGIRNLSRNIFTRDILVYDGTIMALTGLLNGENWRVSSN